MRCFLVMLSLLFFAAKAQSLPILMNVYGELSNQGELLVFTASTSSVYKLQMTSGYDEVTLHLPEGSYIKVLADKIIRYSKLTDQQEIFMNAAHVQQNWQISDADQQTYTAFNLFIQSYGDLGRFMFPSEQLLRLDSQESLVEPEYKSSSITPACSIARQRLDTEGYGGFSTFERCTRTARWANELAAASVSVACLVPQPTEPATCATALAALAVAVSAHEDSRYSCRKTYTRSYRNTNDICYKNSGLSICYDRTYLFDGAALKVSHGVFPELQRAHDNWVDSACEEVGGHYSIAQDMVAADPVGSFSIK